MRAMVLTQQIPVEESPVRACEIDPPHVGPNELRWQTATLPSHFFRHSNAEKIESPFQSAGGQFAKRETGGPSALLRFQNRTRFVKSVEGIGQLEKIIRENVRPKIVQDLRRGLRELAELL